MLSLRIGLYYDFFFSFIPFSVLILTPFHYLSHSCIIIDSFMEFLMLFTHACSLMHILTQELLTHCVRHCSFDLPIPSRHLPPQSFA